LKRVLVKSVFDAFDYVMDHYYPAGLEEFAERTDRYAVISVQDSHTGGFGFRFCTNKFCTGVLTIIADDIVGPVEGAAVFTADHAREVIEFIDQNREADTLLVHCYGGQSRSLAIGAFAVKYLGGDNSSYFRNGNPNKLIYDTLVNASGIS